MRLFSRAIGLFFLLSILGGFGGGSGILNTSSNAVGDLQGIDSNKASAVPGIQGALLLEDGTSILLLEDGTSNLCLEGSC